MVPQTDRLVDRILLLNSDNPPTLTDSSNSAHPNHSKGDDLITLTRSTSNDSRKVGLRLFASGEYPKELLRLSLPPLANHSGLLNLKASLDNLSEAILFLSELVKPLDCRSNKFEKAIQKQFWVSYWFQTLQYKVVPKLLRRSFRTTTVQRPLQCPAASKTLYQKRRMLRTRKSAGISRQPPGALDDRYELLLTSCFIHYSIQCSGCIRMHVRSADVRTARCRTIPMGCEPSNLKSRMKIIESQPPNANRQTILLVHVVRRFASHWQNALTPSHEWHSSTQAASKFSNVLLQNVNR